MKQSKANGAGGKILLAALGTLPMAGGWLMNWYMMQEDSLRRFDLISAGFLLLWGLLAFTACPWAKSAKEAVLLLHAVAALDLLLLAVQEIVLGAYWSNSMGLWSQLFFLPVLPFASTPTAWIGRIIGGAPLFLSYVIAFTLRVLIAWAGSSLRKRMGKSR